MHRNLSISLVVPCLNEEQGIQKVLESVPAQVDEIIVVDGGSLDRTRDVASSFSRTKVILESRRGYGLAYKRGFAEAGSDIIAAADGDGTYPCRDIPAMVDKLLDLPADFISGSRFPLQELEAMHTLNIIGNKSITALLNLYFGTRLADGLSGMWVFHKKLLNQIRLETDDWNFSPEIKVAVLSDPRLRLVEHHIPYAERKGISKLRPWRVGLSNVLFLTRRRFVSSRP